MNKEITQGQVETAINIAFTWDRFTEAVEIAEQWLSQESEKEHSLDLPTPDHVSTMEIAIDMLRYYRETGDESSLSLVKYAFRSILLDLDAYSMIINQVRNAMTFLADVTGSDWSNVDESI